MSNRYNLGFKDIRLLLCKLKSGESNACTEESNSDNAISYDVVGKVGYQIEDKSGEINLAVLNTTNCTAGRSSNYCIVRLVDDREMILVKDSEISRISEYPTLFPIFLASLAHEIGHYVSGHLSDQWDDLVGDGLEDKTILQKKLFDSRSGDRYLNSCITSIINGGYRKKELEADIVAVKMVGLSDVLAIHSLDMDFGLDNICPALEKMNRCKKLVSLVQTGKLKKEPNWNLVIDQFQS